MERVIKNIVFDLGGVIMTLDPAEALRRFKALGLSDAERYLDAYTQSGIFGNLEEGKITAEDFRSKLSSLTGHELTFDECKHAWLGYRKDVPQRNLDLLKELRAKGYRLILLSNTNPFMMDWALSCEFDGKGSSLNDYFDALYLSYRLGIMKPAPDFSDKCLTTKISCRKRHSLSMTVRAMLRLQANWGSLQCARITVLTGPVSFAHFFIYEIIRHVCAEFQTYTDKML